MTVKSNKERLTAIETSQEFIREDIKEIKEVCKEIPRMKTIVGFFSILISAVVAGVTSYFVRHTS